MTWQKFDQPASRPHGTNRIPSGVRDRGEASSKRPKRPKRTGLVTAIVTAVAGVVVSSVVAALRSRR